MPSPKESGRGILAQQRLDDLRTRARTGQVLTEEDTRFLLYEIDALERDQNLLLDSLGLATAAMREMTQGIFDTFPHLQKGSPE